MSDMFDSEEWKDFARRAEQDMAPKLEGADISISIVPSGGPGDAKFWAELGCAIMLDKPIVALVRPGVKTSKKLMMVADEIIECDLDTQEGRRTLGAQIQAIAEKYAKDD